MLASQCRAFAAKHRDDDLERLFQLLEPIGEGSELDAERIMFLLEPSRSYTQLGASSRDDVERGYGLREHGRVAVSVTCYQRAEPNILGLSGERGQQRVALEHVLVGLAEHW